MTHLKLKSLREERQLTQEYMASALGISQNAYSQIETGKTSLKVEQLMNMAKVLDVDPGQLLTPDSVIVNIHDNKIDAGAIFYTGEQHLHMESKEIVEVLKEQLVQKDELIKTLTGLLKNKVQDM